MVISSPFLTDIKNWLVQSKRLWVINAPCYCNEALTSPVQTATGKDTSNPLMADADSRLEAKVSSAYNKITKQMIIKIKNAVKKRLDTILKSSIRRNLKLTSEVQIYSMAGGSDDQENPDINQNPPNPPIQTPQAPHSVSTVKLPTLKKGDNYDIWAMKIEHYITHTDYPLWQIILNGNSPKKISTDTNGIIRVLPPKSAEDFLAIERERKARTTLLMALPEDHLYGFHNISDAKEIWDAIKSRRVEPKVLIEPRVWSDAPIIEENELDSDDDYEIRPSKEQVTPSYAFVNTAKHVKTPKEPGIKREYSNARTPQQNGVAERKNMTLIEAARTMLADSLLPNTFWAEAVNTACYVLNRVLVTKPQNKTPYELLTGKIPIISYIRPFGCHVTILNTIDHLGKFDGKADEGFLVGYSLSSKAFRVYNLVTKKVEENLHVNFLENKPNITGKGPEWLFDIDYLTDSMNYHPVRTENQANHTAGPQEVSNSNAGTQANDDAAHSDNEVDQEYLVLPFCTSISSDLKSLELKNGDKDFIDELAKLQLQEQEARDAADLLERTFTRSIEELLVQEAAANTSSTTRVNPGSTPVNSASTSDPFTAAGPSLVPNTGIFTSTSYDDEGAVADFTNLDSTVNALEEESWVDAMQEELLQFELQKVWILVDLPFGKKAIRTKWVYRNKKDDRGVVVRNKARLVALGHRQEEGIDYDEVFSPVARIEAIRIFLAFASYIGFMVYQMDVKSAFLYGKIDEEVYVKQPPGFEDPKCPKKNGYRSGTIDKTLFLKKDKKDIILVQVKLTFFLRLQVKQRNDGIFISQDKYVAEILKKFDFVNVKTASTPIETQKPLVKDEKDNDVDIHLYRSMIGSLMYLTASRPDIMFAVYACSRFQVTPKTSHLKAVKRIFSDYASANLDRKSTTGGCQFLGKRLISWQCKKQTIVATSTTKAEYVAAANTICIVKTPVYHSKTNHIEIRHYFIRDAYEKKLIEVLKVHTDDNVADLLTKAFDGPRFNFLVVNIGMLNL
ncbi:putative ribonuclease H-like domain-containing protein [Tanacetum coccineum]